jgi:hypothetical protein
VMLVLMELTVMLGRLLASIVLQERTPKAVLVSA